jgi:diacylglycerol kinase family enzyme
VVETAAGLERLAEVAALERSPRARRMLVIVNPYATTMSDRVKNLVVYALQGRYDVHAVDTQAKGHAIELCREAAHEGYDVVVAFGGDGTVNEAANGLVGSPTPLTCLPGGATNVYGRMLGIPADVVDATEHLLGLADDWRERRVDLGRLGDRRFTFSAGIGLDASVVERVDRNPRLKARFGPWYFAQSAVRTFLERYVVRPPRLEVRVGGETIMGVSAFVQNGGAYTYFQSHPIQVSEGSELDSGDLSGAVLTRANAIDVPTVAFRALSKRAEVARHRRVTPFSSVPEVLVRSLDGRPVPVHVDGDHISDEVEVRFTVEPRALRVIS